MDKKETIETIKKYVGDVLTLDQRIYLTHRHSSKSGMNHSISVFVVYENAIVCLDYYVAILTGRKQDSTNRGVKISGCGMDMGFVLVDELFYHLRGHLKGAEDWQKTVRHVWM